MGDGGGRAWLWVRIALVVFVLAWILGPSELRDSVPILVVFLIALGLEVNFLVGALRGGPTRQPDRRPQEIDRQRYGFEPELEDELDDDWPEPEPRSAAIRRFALGLGVIAALVAVVWFVDARTGWSSIDGDRRVVAVARFSDEASRIAEKPVSIRCDEARDYVGSVQHADGVALVGGELAILTPEVCNDLYRLAFEGDTPGAGRDGRSPSSPTRRGIFAGRPTRGRRSAMRSSRAWRSVSGSGCPRTPRGSSCASS